MARSTIVRVKNTTGTTISLNKAVRIIGLDDSDPNGEPVNLIALASFSSNSTMPASGITLSDILNGEQGIIRTAGIVGNIDTTSANINDEVFVGSSGELLFNDPFQSNPSAISQQIGVVSKVDLDNGQIIVLSLEIRRAHAVTHIDGGADPLSHSQLPNLGADSHKQYLLANGKRSVKGSLNVVNGNVNVTSGNITVSGDLIAAAGNLLVGSGNIGIGTATPDNFLEVEGNVANDFVARFFNNGNNANRGGIEIQAGADDGTGTTDYILAKDGDGGNVGAVRNTSGTFAVVDLSDERVKENIIPSTINGLDIINNLELIQFKFKNNPHVHKIGFRAQQAETVFPDMVSEDNNKLESRKYTSKAALIPVLVKAIQELAERLDTIENKNK